MISASSFGPFCLSVPARPRCASITSFRSLFTFVALLCRIVFDLERPACTCCPGHGPLPVYCTRWDILDVGIGRVSHTSLLSFSPPHLIAPASLFILTSALGIVVSSSPVHSSPRIYLISSAFGSSYLLTFTTVHDHRLASSLLLPSFNFGHIALAVTFVVVPAPPSSVHPCAAIMTYDLMSVSRLPVDVRCYLWPHCMLHEG
ncbi:hypothetical protein V8D89_005995 [Ganoderma adspersum]